MIVSGTQWRLAKQRHATHSPAPMFTPLTQRRGGSERVAEIHLEHGGVQIPILVVRDAA